MNLDSNIAGPTVRGSSFCMAFHADAGMTVMVEHVIGGIDRFMEREPGWMGIEVLYDFLAADERLAIF